MIVEYGREVEDYEIEENSKCWFCPKVLDPYEEPVYVWEDVETPTGWEQVFVCEECHNERIKS